MMLYYDEGFPQGSLCPDLFVVKNCDPRRRVTFKTWEERRIPDFVLEILSESTYREDCRSKLQIYERIGVPEYFLYDPEGAWLQPALQAYRLVKRGYQPLKVDDHARLRSRRLGIDFSLEEGQLVLVDAATGGRLLSAEERAAALRAEIALLKA